MDKPVPKVMKSKSSNSAIYTKTNKNNKQSRSNAEFQPNVLKKRVNSLPKQKAPPRPRPGSKRFLTSVLTILSKSTTGTQHPELDHAKSSKTHKNNLEASIEKRAKRKYKSRVLNDNQDEKLIVLQSTKDIINTPSLYSERSQDTLKTTLSRLVKNSDLLMIDKGIDVDVKKRQRKDKKVTIDDPATLVEDKKDPGLYSFFVDLLQTTISGYNLSIPNVELRKPSNSKIDLAINESVAKKLNVARENETPRDMEKLSNICCLTDENWSDIGLRDHTLTPMRYSKIDLLPKQRHTKSKRESFNTKVILPKAYSGLFPHRKSYTAKNKKKIVINLLKRELSMDTDSFVEPQNIYQALRNIARNKRKHQKTIRFTQADNGDECIFKQKKVISLKSKNQVEKESESGSNFDGYVKKYPSYESLHSLEVYDYDFDQKRSREKKIFYTRPSFVSVSEQNRVNENLIDVSDGFYGLHSL